MDRLQSMQVFSRVIELNGFAAAARDLDMSPSVVTRLINELEEHLSTRLINRTTRKLVLTEAGERYLDHVRRILSDVAHAEAEASSDTANPRGLLKLLVPPSFAVHQLASQLPRFHALYPHISIDLSAPGMVETLDESFDVSIIIERGKPLDGNFVARRLAHTKVILCASPGYLDVRGRPKQPTDLAHHAMLSPKMAGDLTLRPDPEADEPLNAAPMSSSLPNAVLRTTHLDICHAAAMAGLGIGGFPSYMVADALAQKRLERVLPQWHLFSMAIHAAVPTRKHLPARTSALVNFLVDTFGGQQRDPWLKDQGGKMTAAVKAA
ncbi:MAG: LysR family transcriptional regulator [Rubrivivax sp.]|nr:MAG: LysR family transcriptional regulator [Rubrivivax sp.]